MLDRSLVLMGLVAALAAGAFFYLWMGGDEPARDVPGGEMDSPELPAPKPEPADPAPTPASAPEASRAVRKAPREQVDRKRAHIRERLERAPVDDAHPAPAASAPAPVEPPKLDEEYIRESVRDLIPVIRECYENALEDEPELGGKLVMKFEILGDEEVGGVVDEVEIDAEQSTIGDADMRECMRESMYTLELPAPDAGGHVFVTYPFVFTPE